MKYIVYKITNNINGKVYIGQTTETIEKRWKRHCGYQLNDGTYLHNAMKKYGTENFNIEKVDEADNQNELNSLEYFYINKYKDNCYNTKFECNKCLIEVICLFFYFLVQLLLLFNISLLIKRDNIPSNQIELIHLIKGIEMYY